jgi:site-specific DNA-methyltransferase (adenine-specific)
VVGIYAPKIDPETIMNRVLFSGRNQHWTTPEELYAALDEEFHFTLDPCPLHAEFDGLAISWAGHRVFCNPPYGRGVARWLEKAKEADVAVYLLPARTDTRWWHQFAPLATEIRFLQGRLRFGGAKHPAPFPSVVLVFRR